MMVPIRSIGFVVGLHAALLLLAAVPVTVTAAPVPGGPRLAYVKWGRAVPGVRLETAGPMGSRRRAIVGDSELGEPLPEWGFAPAWSPDGSKVVFSGARGERKPRLFIATMDGKQERAIPGTVGGFRPIFAPDGRTIAFARLRSRVHFDLDDPPYISSFDSTTTWTVEIDGRNLRRLTPWRNGLEVTPSSFAPDGSMLAASRRDESENLFDEAVGLPMDGGPPIVFARKAHQPTFSPDGSLVALFRYVNRDPGSSGKGAFFRGALDVLQLDSGATRRLARTTYLDQSPPSWDPSGERLAYAQAGNVMQVNADGTCRQRILAHRPTVSFGGPAWQPGPGREAGPIVC